MSTPQSTSGTPAVEKDKSKRRSIQRFVSKIIKTGKSAKKTEPTGTGEASTSAAPPTVSEIPAATTVAAPEPTRPLEADPIPAESSTRQTAISVGARQLAEKHGIEIQEDWPYPTRPPIGERVEKPIRMRVRRYCHVCQSSFGSQKTCPACSHKRCSECPRSPAAKTEKKKTKTKHKEFDPYENLTMPSKTGGQDLVYRKIRQRVHYKCHKCETDFAGQKLCGNCSHNRCKRCHREPIRKPKPAGEIKRKKIIRWTCSECDTPSNITKACANCNHARCNKCTREIPKKKKRAPLEGTTSETDTKEEEGVGQSLIDKVSSALAATSITS